MDLQAFWDKKNAKYADEDWAKKPSLFAQWSRAYMPTDGKLLELGAGNGQDSIYFDSEGFSVTSTDFSLASLERAKSDAPEDIKFMAVDIAQPLPFGDESFEAVYAHLSLHYFDEKTTHAVFAEIHRVLKPGGILAALFNSTDDPELHEGKVIEPNFVEVDNIPKRFFDSKVARDFAKDFEIIVADNEGSTYKDEAKGVRNLIRLMARRVTA